jgi:hypothetical protein
MNALLMPRKLEISAVLRDAATLRALVAEPAARKIMCDFVDSMKECAEIYEHNVAVVRESARLTRVALGEIEA